MSMLMSFRECFREPSGIFRGRLQPDTQTYIHIFVHSYTSCFRDCFRRPSGTFRDRRAFKKTCSTHVNVVCILMSMLMSFRECFRELSGIFRDRLQPNTHTYMHIFIHSYRSFFRDCFRDPSGTFRDRRAFKKTCSTHVNVVCILMSMLMSFRACFREPSGIFRDRLQPDTHIHIFIYSHIHVNRTSGIASGILPGPSGIAEHSKKRVALMLMSSVYSCQC